MNQVELGYKIGISKQTVSKYEKGTVLPNSKSLKDIADALNCSTDYLLGRVKEKNHGVVEIPYDGKKIVAIVDNDVKNDIANNNLERLKELEKACIDLILENKKLKDQLKK